MPTPTKKAMAKTTSHRSAGGTPTAAPTIRRDATPVTPGGHRLPTAKQEKRLMPFFEWSSSLSVGLESVDRQHRLLIGCINDLGDAVEQSRGGFNLQRMLERLRNYTRVHFAYEEAMFKVYRYESADDHAHAHHAFVRMIEACERRHAVGEDNVGEELLRYLKHWLSDHILVEDMAYARVLKTRGAE